MSKVLLLTFLLISFTNASYTLNKDNNIDAGPIEHWRENWAVAPIEVSYPHASASVSVNVYLTFNIRITTALAADNIVEIHFPPSYSNSPNPYTETLTSAKAAGSEFSVRVLASSGTPSSAGAYGPFKVYTRKNTGGQIIDMTNAFGSVYFEASIGTPATLNA